MGDLISNLTGDSFMSQGLNRIWEVQGVRCPHRSPCSWTIHRIRGSSQMGLGSLCLNHTKQLSSVRLLHLLRIGHRAACGCLPHEETMVNTPLPGCASLPLSSLSTFLSLYGEANIFSSNGWDLNKRSEKLWAPGGFVSSTLSAGTQNPLGFCLNCREGKI